MYRFDDDAIIDLEGQHDEALGVMQIDSRLIGVPYFKYGLILADYDKWGKIQNEFDEWLKDYDAERNGILLGYNEPGFYILMKMKWS
jgi:hypothetical protein